MLIFQKKIMVAYAGNGINQHLLMTKANKIKADIIFSTCILFTFLAVLALMYAISDNTPKTWFSAAIEACLFPVVVFAIQLGVVNLYLVLLFTTLNIILYALLFIKLFSRKLIHHTKYTPFTLSFIVACLVPSIVIVWAVYKVVTS